MSRRSRPRTRSAGYDGPRRSPRPPRRGRRLPEPDQPGPPLEGQPGQPARVPFQDRFEEQLGDPVLRLGCGPLVLAGTVQHVPSSGQVEAEDLRTAQGRPLLDRCRIVLGQTGPPDVVRESEPPEDLHRPRGCGVAPGIDAPLFGRLHDVTRHATPSQIDGERQSRRTGTDDQDRDPVLTDGLCQALRNSPTRLQNSSGRSTWIQCPAPATTSRRAAGRASTRRSETSTGETGGAHRAGAARKAIVCSVHSTIPNKG